jgi:ferredoxin--NADP+ reductase
MPDQVLAELRSAQIEHVWLVGRRGPEHAAFTTPELRELLETPGIGVTIDGFDPGAVDEAVLERHARANVAAIAKAVAGSPPTPARWLHLLFWHRPAELSGAGRVQAVRLAPTAPGGAPVVVPADLVLRSIGYRGVPLPGVPFDEGRIPNLEGRVAELDGSARPGEYAVGWIKRGPVGLIGSNKKDAAETVANLLADLAVRPRRELADLDATLAARGVRPSSLADWRRIDEAEIARGGIRGSERTKIEAWHDLLDLVRRELPGGPLADAEPPEPAKP